METRERGWKKTRGSLRLLIAIQEAGQKIRDTAAMFEKNFIPELDNKEVYAKLEEAGEYLDKVGKALYSQEISDYFMECTRKRNETKNT